MNEMLFKTNEYNFVDSCFWVPHPTKYRCVRSTKLIQKDTIVCLFPGEETYRFPADSRPYDNWAKRFSDLKGPEGLDARENTMILSDYACRVSVIDFEENDDDPMYPHPVGYHWRYIDPMATNARFKELCGRIGEIWNYQYSQQLPQQLPKEWVEATQIRATYLYNKLMQQHEIPKRTDIRNIERYDVVVDNYVDKHDPFLRPTRYFNTKTHKQEKLLVDDKMPSNGFEEGEEEARLLDIEALTAAIRLEPAAHHYATRGFAFLKRGRLQDALGDANRALQINSDSARAYLLRAKTHWELRNHTDAYSDMCQAQRIDYNEEHDDLHQMMRRAGQRKRPGKRPVRGEGDEYPDLYPSTVARSPTVKMYLPVPASGPMSPAMEPFHYICSFSELTDSKTVIRNIVLALNHEYQEAYSLHQTINEATTLQIADDYPFLGAFINQPDERESANLCFVDPNEWIDRIGNRYENVPLAIHNAASLPMQHLDLLQRQALVATSNIEAGTELMLSYGRDSVRPRLRYR